LARCSQVIVISPSVHESGHIYQWEVFGDIPEWSWREFTDEGDAQAVMDLTLKTMEEVGSVVFSKVHMKAEGSIRDSWG
jgi:hypothetical protein